MQDLATGFYCIWCGCVQLPKSKIYAAPYSIPGMHQEFVVPCFGSVYNNPNVGFISFLGVNCFLCGSTIKIIFLCSCFQAFGIFPHQTVSHHVKTALHDFHYLILGRYVVSQLSLCPAISLSLGGAILGWHYIKCVWLRQWHLLQMFLAVRTCLSLFSSMQLCFSTCYVCFYFISDHYILFPNGQSASIFPCCML